MGIEEGEPRCQNIWEQTFQKSQTTTKNTTVRDKDSNNEFLHFTAAAKSSKINAKNFQLQTNMIKIFMISSS